MRIIRFIHEEITKPKSGSEKHEDRGRFNSGLQPQYLDELEHSNLKRTGSHNVVVNSGQ